MYGICMSEKCTYSDEPLKIIPKIQKKINSGKIRMQTAADGKLHRNIILCYNNYKCDDMVDDREEET